MTPSGTGVDDPAALTAAPLAEEDRRLAAPDPGREQVTAPVLPVIEEQSLREAISAGGAWTITLLFLLNLVDEFDRAALAVLGPDIQETFGISDAVLGFVNGIGGVAVFAGAVPFGLLADRRARVPLIAAATAVWAAFALLGGLARNAAMLGMTRVVNGIGKGVIPAHSSLLADAYPVAARGRIYARDAARSCGPPAARSRRACSRGVSVR